MTHLAHQILFHGLLCDYLSYEFGMPDDDARNTMNNSLRWPNFPGVP